MSKKKWWKYKRLKGYSSPKRGDISAVNHPNHNTIFIKRIVALPGDTLQIINGALLINGEEQVLPKKSLYYSKVKFKNRNTAHHLMDSLKIEMFYNNAPNKPPHLSGYITVNQLKALQKHPNVIEADIDSCRPDTAWTVYPHSEHLKWNIDNYGPFCLPFKGMKIHLTTDNNAKYGHIIECEKELSSQNKENSNYYTFDNDYFFIIGDNFHDSDDSRYFGPVKEELLIGKASFILYSKASKFKIFQRF